MSKAFVSEIWKEVQFDFEYVNTLRVEVSNFGRVRSFSKLTKGSILAGSLINGYRIVRFKFFKPHNTQTTEQLNDLRGQIFRLAKEVGSIKLKLKTQLVKDKTYRDFLRQIEAETKKLTKIRAVYQKEYRASELKRTINHGELVHRLVAEYFLEKPTKDQILVGHLDYDKLNNQSYNLKWMTREENVVHQRFSPYVIEAKKNLVNARNTSGKAYKLSLASVMLIKKKIQQGIPLRIIAKSFKVSETQLLRIKRGENWGNVEAAE